MPDVPSNAGPDTPERGELYPFRVPVLPDDAPAGARAAWDAFKAVALLGSIGATDATYQFGADGRFGRVDHPNDENLTRVGLTPGPL